MPDHVAGARQWVAARHVSHPEIGEFGEPGPCRRLGEHHHVLGLDVAVDHPARVRVLQGLAECDPDASDVAVGDRARMHQLRKGSPPNELRNQVHVVLVGGKLIDGDDARVIQPGSGARLPFDALAGPAVARNRLHGHLALELLVPGEPDNPESTGPEPALQAVAAQDQAYPGAFSEPLCRVRAAQRQCALFVREACLGTSHPSFVFGLRRARPAPRAYSHRPKRQRRPQR